MAIPRYQREKINAQVETERFGGMADQAAAKGFSGIAQAQGQLAGQHGQRANQEVASFSERLNNFTSQFDHFTRQDATIRARKEGITDVSTRRKEIADIQNKYRDNPKLMEEKIAEVETATMQDNFSFYGRAYQNSVSSAYATQVEVDARAAAAEAEALAQKDPAKFKAMYAPYRDEIIKGAPTQTSSVAAQQAFDKHGASTWSRMMKADYTEKQADIRENETKNIVALSKMVLDSSSRGDEASTSANMGQLAAQLKSQVDRKLMGADEAQFILREAQVGAQTNAFMRKARVQVDQGLGMNYTRKLMNGNHPDSKTFKKLPVDAQAKVIEDIKNMSEHRHDSYTKAQKQEEEQIKLDQNEEYNGVLDEMAGGKRYTVADLQKKVQSNQLRDEQAKQILDAQDVVTDPKIHAHLNRESQLVTMSEEQILALDDISFTDKGKMIDKRSQALEGSYNWVSTPQGKEVTLRLKEDYGIAADPLFVMPGQEDPKRKEYAAKRREMHDAIMEYPVEDRPGKAMEVYNKITAEHNEVKEKAATEKKQTRDKASYDEMMETINKKNDETFRYGTYTVEDYARDNDNVTLDRAKRLEADYSKGSTPKNEKVQKPKSHTTAPTVPNYMDNPEAQRRAAIAGYEPIISGRNVDLVNTQDKVKQAAYPILQKYKLGIKDAYRSTPGGGAKKSQHLEGNALDVTWAGRTIEEKVAIIKDMKAAGFKGFGIGENTIHVDMREAPAQWSYIGGTSTGGGFMPRWATQALRS